MLTLVTRKLANVLHANGLPGTAITIAGIGGEQLSSHQVEIRLQSLRTSRYIDVKPSVVYSIPICSTSNKMPRVNQIEAFRDLHLSDPEYTPGAHFDLLLGMEHCNKCSLPNSVFSADYHFKAERTIFGWAVGGSTPGATGRELALQKVTFHDMYNGTDFDFSCTFRVNDRAMLYPSPERWRKCSKMPNFVLLYI